MATTSSRRNGATKPALKQLAEWSVGFDGNTLSAPALHAAKLLLLDTIGCALAGWHEDTARTVARSIKEIGGSSDCQVIGSTLRTNGVNAVLANGMLARVLDLNDYVASDPSAGGELGGHPSDNIPVALAAAEAGNRSGRALLEAIVIGYEVYNRAAGLMERDSPWDRVSSSGLVAPAMAGRLLGLEPATLAHALALSVARCATSAMVRSGDISAAKSLANALVAQNGYQAVLLGARGLTGPLAILEHPRGLRAVFSDLNHLDELFAPMPATPFISRARIKAYPCVATAQSLAAAAVELHASVKDRLESIETVTISMADYPVIRRHQSEPVRMLPDSREAADHSFPFVSVVGILDGRVGLAQFENDRWHEPRTRELMQHVTMQTDAGLNERSSAGYPSRVEVICKDGQRYANEVLEPPGGGGDGLDEGEVIAKFERLADALIPKDRAARIVECAMDIEGSTNCKELVDAFAVDVTI